MSGLLKRGLNSSFSVYQFISYQTRNLFDSLAGFPHLLIIYFSPNWQMIKEIMNAVTIPVMAKCRIGHFAEAQILEALEVDMIDESEGIFLLIFVSYVRAHIKLYVVNTCS